MNPVLGRRGFLRIGLYGGAVLLLPAGPPGCGDAWQPAGRPQTPEGQASPDASPGRYLAPHPYETVRALTGVIIPEDPGEPGAVTARVADYIDFLLGAFRVDPPRIYSVGPYSGRHGGENGFAQYLPLSRVKEIAWRSHIEGSQGIPEREFNGPVVGLQEIYTRGLEELDRRARDGHGADFKDLYGEAQLALFRTCADTAFRDAVLANTVEGMYAAPEYGGNAGRTGWRNIRYEGDRQPIGYTRRQVEEADEDGNEARLRGAEAAEAAALLLQVFGGRDGGAFPCPAEGGRS